jgi:chemotaxis protein methyltransferase CheR
MPHSEVFKQKLGSKDFLKLKSYVENYCGIKLSETKRNMVEGRLRKRMKALGITSYKDYLEYAFEDINSAEQVNLINVLTTNKTDFFREPNHFEILKERVLPQLAVSFGVGTHTDLKVWSAGCSTGEEPYTLSMVLAEYYGLDKGYKITATDICTDVLAKARKGIYSEEKAMDIPYDYKKKYLMRSIERERKLVRFKPDIRSKIKYARLNLKNREYNLPEKVDIAFCRNVIIYFDHKTQEEIINRICSFIRPGGFLFLGHSESVHGMNLPIKVFAPTVYLRV